MKAKKFIYAVMALAAVAFSFTSCEDVPEPYSIPVSASGGAGGELEEGIYLNQSFATSLGEFKTIGNNANISWIIDYSSACITGYKDYGSGTKSNQAGVTYLVSPEIDLSEAKEAHVEMSYALNYERGDINTNNALLICKDYTDDPTKAKWVAIPYATDGVNSSFTFVDVTSNIPAEFIGNKVRIALRHTCTDSQSSTWEVKSLAVKEGKVEETGGETGGETGEVETGKGSLSDPYTIAEAVNAIKNNSAPSTEVHVKGIVSSLDYYNANYKSLSYYLSDDGKSNDLQVYSGKGLNGADFSSKDDLKVGQIVVVKGILKAFDKNGTIIYEIDKNSTIISIEGEGDEPGTEEPGTEEPETPVTGEKATVSKAENIITITYDKATPSSETVTCNLGEQGWENNTDPTVVTLSDGTTISFAQEGGNNAPKYYDKSKGVRMYALNSMTITGTKAIAAVKIICDAYQGTIYVGNELLYTAVDGNTWKVVNDYTGNSGGTQLRPQTIEITYAQ